MARLGLTVADRVMFVGNPSADASRSLVTPQTEDRLFLFDSNKGLLPSLSLKIAVEDELIMLKSNSDYHLERLIFGSR